MDNEQPMLRKVPLKNLIGILVEMYNHGVDYVDIGGVSGEEQDKMAISFTKEYMTEEGKENLSKIEEELLIDDEHFKTKLTDEDLDQLI